MTRNRLVFALLAIALGVVLSSQAGDLEPPAAPAPTMVTLEDIYNRVATGSSSPDTCLDNAGRFAICGNGTVKDTVTGLYWLANASCLGSGDWAAGGNAAATLADGQCGLTDGSTAGDWRVPTEAEWQVMVDQATTNGCTGLYFPDVAGTGCCDTGTCAFTNLSSGVYWTATTSPSLPVVASVVNLANGQVSGGGKSLSSRHWAVRSGR